MLKRSQHQFWRSLRREQGFTLLEVMVSVFILAVGLLGIAKMQALAIASTQVSSSRSLVALQASSLAAAMHGGRAWWSNGLAPPRFTINGATVADSSGALSASVPACTSAAPCTAAQLAARDVQQWAAHMNPLFPSHATQVTCSTVVNLPISCVISITWTEKTVSSLTQSAATQADASADRTYVLYVEP